MTDDDKRWQEDGARFGWEMPSASWWKRMPVIRAIRYAWNRVQVERHARFHVLRGALPSGYDSWVLYGIARGFERPARPSEDRP